VDIWRKPIYLPCLQPPLTDEALAETEQMIGHKLPEEYVALLRVQNGGYIRYRFANPDICDCDHTQIYGIGSYAPHITNEEMDWEAYDDVSFELSDLFAFDGDGHWLLCLDYRGDMEKSGRAPVEEPRVTFIDLDMDEQKVIAQTFREYLSLLELDFDDEYVIEADADLSAVAADIARCLGVEMAEPNTFDYGYPLYRYRYTDSWVWLSPNRVQKGFIRQGAWRYDELRSLVDEANTALRFPFAPENGIILDVSDKSALLEVVSLLRDAGYRVSPLKDCLV